MVKYLGLLLTFIGAIGFLGTNWRAAIAIVIVGLSLTAIGLLAGSKDTVPSPFGKWC